jgi:geranylgeranylglycerol-phosphate geranylgeranyltransferase
MAGRMLAHLETWRPYTVGYVGLVGLSGAYLAMPGAPWWRLLGAWAGPTLGWLGGLYGGDYFDRDLDAIGKPHRPIPSGRLRPGTVLAGMITCVAAGAAVAIALNWRTVLFVAAALGGGVAYSKWLKARGLAGNLVRGSLTAFAFLFGTMAVAPWPPAWLLPAAMIFWLHDACSNLIGTLRDTADDRRGGYQTLVVRRGERSALLHITVLYFLAISLAGWLLATARSDDRWVAVAVAAAAIALGSGALITLWRAGRPLERRTALRAHEVFVVERVLLASAVLALAARPVMLVVTAAVLAGTVTSQRTMRERYEFEAPAHRGGTHPGMQREVVHDESA